MNDLKRYILPLLMMLPLMSCEEAAKPEIDQVWINMTDFPVGKVECAYPDQTLCLYGRGFSGLQEIIVNGTRIDIDSTLVYDTDRNITFRLPEDVAVSDGPQNMYIKVITHAGEDEYAPFLVKQAGQQPEVTSVSSVILVPESVLVIRGKNLDGVSEVYLPAAYDKKVLCAFSEEYENTSEELHVVVPDSVRFATGQLEVVMEKHDSVCVFSYEEKVFSEIYDFIN